MTAAPVPASSSPAPRRWIKNRRDLLVFVGVVLLVSLVVSIAAFLLWTATPARPGAAALAALADSATVTVTDAGGIVTFSPAEARPVGLIFYPGALVDARAYAPILRPLAEAGYVVVTTDMPLNLAIFDIGAGDRLRAAHPEIARWAIAGHSMGGAMASRYALDSGDLAGVTLIASFPFGDLSGAAIEVLSIYGDQDGLLPLEQVESSKTALPADTVYTLLEGANHAQFGDYGAQRGDLDAAIPAPSQWDATASALLAWLERLAI